MPFRGASKFTFCFTTTHPSCRRRASIFAVRRSRSRRSIPTGIVCRRRSRRRRSRITSISAWPAKLCLSSSYIIGTRRAMIKRCLLFMSQSRFHNEPNNAIAHQHGDGRAICLRQARAMPSWPEKPSMNIEFRERPTREHLFRLESGSLVPSIGHIRRDKEGFSITEHQRID
jgi:hypothetical protein